MKTTLTALVIRTAYSVSLHMAKAEYLTFDKTPCDGRPGWYSVTTETSASGMLAAGESYPTYWGPTKPTPKQFRRMKKYMRSLEY